MQYENYRPSTQEELITLQKDAEDSFITSVNRAFSCTQLTPENAITYGIAIVKARLQLAIANAGLAGGSINFKKPKSAIEAIDTELTYRNMLRRADEGDYSLLSTYFFYSANEFNQLAKKSPISGAKKYFQRISDSWNGIANALPVTQRTQ